MFYIKTLRFLFVLFLAISVCLTSDSWGMDPKTPKRRLSSVEKTSMNKKQKTEASTSIFDLPKDLLSLMFLKYLSPQYYVKMGEVCTTFNNTMFNDIEYWKNVGGWHFSPSTIEKGEKALNILNQLFENAPDRLKTAFPCNWPLTSLPFETFNKNPSVEGLKYFYISQHLKISNSDAAAVPYLEKAAFHEHPRAVWERLEDAHQKPSAQFTAEVKIKFGPGFLNVALAGYPPAQGKLAEEMLSALQWRPGAPLSEQNSNFSSLFAQFVALAEVWPEVQEPLLKCVMTPQWQKPPVIFPLPPDWVPSSFNQFKDIAEGKPVRLSFTSGVVDLTVKWQKAWGLLGRECLDLLNKYSLSEANVFLNKAYDYFMKDSPETDNESGHLLAQHVASRKNFMSEDQCIAFFHKILQNFPQSSGTAHAQLTLNTLQKLLWNPSEDAITGFFQGVEQTYGRMCISSLIFSAQGAHERRTTIMNASMKVATASDYIKVIGDALSKHQMINIDTKMRFLYWAMTTPHYIYIPWVSNIIADYLDREWGQSLCGKGEFPKSKIWTSKDKELALKYFQYREIVPLNNQLLRKFHFNFMALKNLEGKEFVLCFKEYCGTYTRFKDTVSKTTCNALKSKVNAFLKAHKNNSEVPLLFAKLPFDEKTCDLNLRKEHYIIAAKNGSKEAKTYLEANFPNDVPVINAVVLDHNPEEEPMNLDNQQKKKPLRGKSRPEKDD